MSTSYTIWLSTPTGVPLAVIDSFVRLEYRRIVNSAGHSSSPGSSGALPLRLLLAAENLPLHLVGRDSRLEIWRTPPNPAGESQMPVSQELDTETVWLVRRVRKLLTNNGERLVELEAVPAIDLLASRIVPYPVGSTRASKSGPADDLMKEVVRENLGIAVSDSERRLSTWLDVAPNLGLAPGVSKSFARRNVLHVLRELAEASAQAGTPLYFDIVSPARGRLEFRTYTGARGSDHTFPAGINPVVLSPETGTLAQIDRSFDYADEFSVVYAAGQGVESERLVAEAVDATRSTASPFSRRERLVDARQIADVSALAAEAQAALAAGHPRRIFQALIVNTPGMAYGRHWRWGDRVTASFDGEIIDCHIEELHVVVESGRETVRAWLRADGLEPLSLGGQVDKLAADERETTYQQVQRGALPAGTALMVPPGGHMLVYGRYEMVGSLTLDAGARLVVLV
jgi:hypothetical protein